MNRLPDAVLSKIEVAPSGCWLWTAGRNREGYPIVNPRWTGTNRAHRAVYLLLVGPIEHTLDHLCRVRHCVNPDHMEDVTAGENARRGVALKPRKTHCKWGHAYDETNTYIDPRGGRQCRACRAAAERRRYYRKKAA